MKNHNNDLFIKQIIEHNNDLPTDFNIDNLNIASNSWFDIKKYNTNNCKKDIKFKYKFHKQEIIKCQKIQMILSSEQKKILNKWFFACTSIYNEMPTIDISR